ncbi:MAG: LysM peptidoglycan-binding domain-containing protein [Thermoleophilia bacterium]
MTRFVTFSQVSPRRLAAVLALLGAMLLIAVGQADAATVTVRPGDTLSGIAARHGVSPAALAAANRIADPDHIVLGSSLTIPGSGGATGASGGTVTVRPGDSLSAIAARHGVSASALAAVNGIRDPNRIVAGTRLRLPGGATVASAPASSGATVTVRSGDTLSAIATRAGSSVAALAALNGLTNPNAIHAGQVLRVPGGATTGGMPAPSYLAPTVTVARSEVGPLITRAAGKYGVDANLARAISYHESGYSQFMQSHAGAIGVMQLMPYTADWVGPSLVGRRLDPRNVYDNIEGGVAYIAWLQRRTGNARRTAMAYYQGLRSLTERGPYDDTVAYARSVMALYGRV